VLESSLGFAVKQPSPRGAQWTHPHCVDVGPGSMSSKPGGCVWQKPKTSVAHKPVWVDLSTSDAEGARNYYSKLFGWKVRGHPDPQYGGYALAKISARMSRDRSEAVTGRTQRWMVLHRHVRWQPTRPKSRGGRWQGSRAPHESCDQGAMSIVADPTGAVFGIWQAQEHDRPQNDRRAEHIWLG